MTRASQRGVQPGGVVLIKHRGATILHAAYGLSRKYATLDTLAPDPIPATTDTLYDLASISKLFTTTVVMRLVEQGKLSLDDPVAATLPEFAANGKGAITLRHLLTHTSGLPDYLKLWELEDSPEARVRRVLRTAPLNPPGRVFRYSDLGLITLGKVAEEVGGGGLDKLVRDLVTTPLGLQATMYRPPAELKKRIAPTEDESNVGRDMVWGEVHDENAWSLDGVGGHAGLFGTAEDLAVFAQMYLDGGSFRGTQLLKRETVAEMTRNQIGDLEWRGLGWELNADYYMGSLASPTTYGHTGFTGTSLVVDPKRELIVVLLSNRVHPTRTGPNQNPVRQAVADAALAAVSASSAAVIAPPTLTSATRVLTGADVLLGERKELLRGQRLGLVTNGTGRGRDGTSTIDLLASESSWQLKALFGPEHGIRGEVAAGDSVDAATDQKTGLPVHSLYGETTRPTARMLADLDALVYDIQDVGARVYTYPSTLLELLRAGAEHKVSVVVLDRPNPIGGEAVEGNVLDPRFTSFVGAAPIAMRYGMTIGELARYFNAELSIGADLTVVPVQGWQRSMWFDATGLSWVNPSPNLRSLAAATVYPGTVLFEGTTMSEGRGTDHPFEWLGAPGLDAAAWADRLNSASLPGVRFSAATRTPEASKHAGRECEGVVLEIVDRSLVRPMALGVTMLSTVPQALEFNPLFDRLAGTDQLRLALQAGATPRDIVASWQPDLERFSDRRSRYLLY
jgi:uncharacterized protein YbbC (DUF1343 family)/CubicO group peptidase (beta-lactamase class C family)